MPQPHWKKAVSTPNEAAADSRFSTAVIAGMSRLRKASTSSRKLKPAIAASSQGSLALVIAAKSSNVAVRPPT